MYQKTLSDICLVKVEDPSSVEDTALLYMRAIQARPLVWAEGTTFNVQQQSSNEIAIKLDLSRMAAKNHYRKLTLWLAQHSNGSTFQTLASAKAKLKWDSLSR